MLDIKSEPNNLCLSTKQKLFQFSARHLSLGINDMDNYLCIL